MGPLAVVSTGLVKALSLHDAYIHTSKHEDLYSAVVVKNF